MGAVKTIFLIILYPVAAVFLVFPHMLGHLFHTRHELYFGLLAAILCLVNGYAGYMQLWDGMDAIIDFQLLCLGGAVIFPLSFSYNVSVPRTFRGISSADADCNSRPREKILID